MGLVLAESADFHLDLPILQQVYAKYLLLLNDGKGMLGTQALIKAYREEN
jgi:hypothetical protein